MTSPYGNTVHHKENVTEGQFAFTTSEAGSYLACFTLDSVKKDAVASVSVNWRIGIAAKDWDTVAKKEKIEVILYVLRFLPSIYAGHHLSILSCDLFFLYYFF